MKNPRCNLLFIIFSLLIVVAYGQDNPKITALYAKVRQFETHPSDTAAVVLRKGCSDRKYCVKSKIMADSLAYRHKTKYFRSGARKEKIMVYKVSPGNRVLILYLVKINGVSTYIKYGETGSTFKREIGIVKEELLIDNKYYQVRMYDRYGVLTRMENLQVTEIEK